MILPYQDYPKVVLSPMQEDITARRKSSKEQNAHSQVHGCTSRLQVGFIAFLAPA
jgi:hypothetical protein